MVKVTRTTWGSKRTPSRGGAGARRWSFRRWLSRSAPQTAQPAANTLTGCPQFGHALTRFAASATP